MRTQRIAPRLARRTALAVTLLAAVCLLVAASARAAERIVESRTKTARTAPKAFGLDSYTVTKISAVGFYPSAGQYTYSTTGSLGRIGPNNQLLDFYVPLDVPAGVVIDYVGFNTITDTPFALGVALYNRTKDGVLTTITTFSSTVHGWDTEFNAAPIGYLWYGFSGNALILHVQQANVPTPQAFGWVEVWWRRLVSPPPPAATFADVPLNHPLSLYIEALAASHITGGCGNGNFCPDAPLTRGQMAVFLAKALGLHWPGDVSF